MIIGYWTIRRTSAVKAEQAARDRAKAISAKMAGLLMHAHVQDMGTLRRWGLAEGLIEDEATLPGVEALSPPRGRS